MGHPTYRVNAIKLKWEIIWTGGLPHLSGLSQLPGVPHLLSNWFMWILRDATRSLPLITSVSVFITKFWPETWLLVSGFNGKKKGKIGDSLRAISLWHSGRGAGKGRRA